MAELAAGLPLVMAVNREYADDAVELSPGDELALIPPVSGGAGVRTWRSGPTRCSLDAVTARVRDPRAGAVVTFMRRHPRRRPPRLRGLRGDGRAGAASGSPTAAIERHGLCAAAVEHRVGRVPLSEPSVVVAASAPHRGEAFAGAREIIDEVKAQAPIWKREEGAWVEGSQPTSA